MATKDKSSGHATGAKAAGKSLSKKDAKRKKHARKMQKQIDPAIRLAMATEPLVSLFSTVNDVFEEDDAFDPNRMKAGFGRIYREWKKCRAAMDPNFKEGKRG